MPNVESIKYTEIDINLIKINVLDPQDFIWILDEAEGHPFSNTFLTLLINDNLIKLLPVWMTVL